MKTIKTIFVLSFLLTTSFLFGQNPNKLTSALENKISSNGINENYTVWIYFNDKGNDIESKLLLSKKELDKSPLKRSDKLYQGMDYASYLNIPVEMAYIDQVTPFLTQLRHQSKWLNAISVEVNGVQFENIASLDCVKSMDIVRTWKTKQPQSSPHTNSTTTTQKSTYSFNYGSSYTQNQQINIPMVHDMGYDGSGIIICVLDAGFNNLEHEVFDTMNILDSYDFVNDDNNVDDENDMGYGGHGTMTLSTIGGFKEGSLIGPAFGASYLLAKTENTDSETQVEEDNWVAGAEWAQGLGAMLTSTSLGYINFDDGEIYDSTELDGNTAVITIAADIMAENFGMVVVNSAGNSGNSTPTTIGAPADGNSVLAIGAVDSSGNRVYFSSIGPTSDGRIKPDVMAMGSGVRVAEPSGDTYGNASGTSFSCPLTAGAAAVLWQMVPTATNFQIYDALRMTANNAGSPNNNYGWGIIDVYAAYEYLQTILGTTAVGDFLHPITLYPNPATDTIYFDLPNDTTNTAEIRIIDSAGKLVNHITNYTNKYPINLSNLQNGVYFCKIESLGNVSNAKFVVAK